MPEMTVQSIPGRSPKTIDCKGGEAAGTNFISQIVTDDLSSGKHSTIRTRFPPEPNGYLHLGHAKSMCLNFGLATQHGGTCNLRFDDTNPEKEEHEYIEGIQNDIKWLGFEWDNLFFASQYFDKLYDGAVDLIKKGLAYVDEQSEEDVKANRGDIATPGVNSPFRDRPVAENLARFTEMREGKHKEGSMVLRAKIDMAHTNPLMRDALMYRIKFADHPRTGSKWCIYPLYDYAHGQSDSYESITHSICTVEFEVHRVLYEWYQESMDIERTRQIEFARLNLSYTVMSKRKLMALVQEGVVNGWDDPRMPTICGMRRRGYTPEGIKDLCQRVGVAKRENLQSLDLLELCIRESLDSKSPRIMGVVDPLLVEITNWPDGTTDELDAKNHPTEDRGMRKVTMSKCIYIEKDDFMENPVAEFHRLSPGKEVRLRWAFWVKCVNVVKEDGKIVKLECTYDPDTKGGRQPADGRKVQGTLHWVSAMTAKPVEYRLYDKMFLAEVPDAVADWRSTMNKESLIVSQGYIESGVDTTQMSYQLERMGFFTWDTDSCAEKLVMNRTVKLVDTLAKETRTEDDKQKEKTEREKKAAERAAVKAAREARKAAKDQK